MKKIKVSIVFKNIGGGGFCPTLLKMRGPLPSSLIFRGGGGLCPTFLKKGGGVVVSGGGGGGFCLFPIYN